MNILNWSPLLDNFLYSNVDDITFTQNGRQYHKCCFLVQTIHKPQTKNKHFNCKFLGISKKGSRESLPSTPSKICHCSKFLLNVEQDCVKDMLMACTILHNVVIKDELGLDLESLNDPQLVMRRGLAFNQLL